MPTTNKLKVLVYGATGVQANPVVWQLLQRGHQPYVFTRQAEKAAAFEAAGARVIVGDMADADRLREASAGMDAIALLIPFFADPVEATTYGRNAIDAARAAGVSLIVWNPTGVIPPERTGNPRVDLRIDIADSLRASAIKHIILQPTAYIENLLGPYTVPFVAQQNKLAYPTPPDMRIGWISAEDMGALVVAALERPELANASFVVSGVANPNGPELAAEFAAALGRPISYHALPPAEFGAILDQAYGPGAGAAAAAFYQALWDNPNFRPSMHTDMQPILERLPVQMLSIREWVAKHASVFTAPRKQELGAPERESLPGANTATEHSGEKPLVYQAERGAIITAAGTTMVFKVRSDATGGRYSLTEYTLPPRFAGPPLHVHRVFEHTFYVLEGTVQVQRATEVIQAGAGDAVYIPSGVAHTFANPHPQPARLLAIDTPGGLEHYYEELAAAFPPGTPLDREVVRQIQERYDTYPPA